MATMPKPPIEPDRIVVAVMDAHPETVAASLGRRMRCSGGVMAPLMTLAEAAASHDLDPADFGAELRAVISVDHPGAHR